MTGQVAGNAQAQTHATDEITDRVGHISGVAREASDHAHAFHGASERLAQLTEELHATVDQFKT